MLNRVALLLMLSVAVPSVSGQPNQVGDSKQSDGTQGQPAVATPNGPDKRANGSTDKPKTDDKLPKWYTALERPDWWLVLAAFSTLGVVSWQSIETRRAAQGAKENAVAALAQVEFMKSKERAQLRIEFAAPEFRLEPKLGGYPVDFQITLDGTTRAYILNESIIVYLSRSKRAAGGWKSFGLPRNLTPEDSPYDGKTLIHNTEFLPVAETDTNKFYSVRRGEDGYTLYADGQIYYRDIFGDEWILEIDRYWDTLAKMWGPFGSGRHDTHRKTSRPRACSHYELGFC